MFRIFSQAQNSIDNHHLPWPISLPIGAFRFADRVRLRSFPRLGRGGGRLLDSSRSPSKTPFRLILHRNSRILAANLRVCACVCVCREKNVVVVVVTGRSGAIVSSS